MELHKLRYGIMDLHKSNYGSPWNELWNIFMEFNNTCKELYKSIVEFHKSFIEIDN